MNLFTKIVIVVIILVLLGFMCATMGYMGRVHKRLNKANVTVLDPEQKTAGWLFGSILIAVTLVLVLVIAYIGFEIYLYLIGEAEIQAVVTDAAKVSIGALGKKDKNFEIFFMVTMIIAGIILLIYGIYSAKVYFDIHRYVVDNIEVNGELPNNPNDQQNYVIEAQDAAKKAALITIIPSVLIFLLIIGIITYHFINVEREKKKKEAAQKAEEEKKAEETQKENTIRQLMLQRQMAMRSYPYYHMQPITTTLPVTSLPVTSLPVTPLPVTSFSVSNSK